ncbi:hypothetical protein [Phormidium sp. CCY1219]|nr:hypothetical protein [Phormidium sp. CCY1219]MEB3828643.1 hypothetical protein [Phormidium sp. CCY1219]
MRMESRQQKWVTAIAALARDGASFDMHRIFLTPGQFFFVVKKRVFGA